MQFELDWAFNVGVHDEFSQGVLVRTMRITQTNLLITFFICADCGLVKVAQIVFVSHPKDAI